MNENEQKSRLELAKSITQFARIEDNNKRLLFIEKNYDNQQLINSIEKVFPAENQQGLQLLNQIIKRLMATKIKDKDVKFYVDQPKTIYDFKFKFNNVFHLLGRQDQIDKFEISSEYSVFGELKRTKELPIEQVKTQLNKINNYIDGYGDQENSAAKVYIMKQWVKLLKSAKSNQKIINYEDADEFFGTEQVSLHVDKLEWLDLFSDNIYVKNFLNSHSNQSQGAFQSFFKQNTLDANKLAQKIINCESLFDDEYMKLFDKLIKDFNYEIERYNEHNNDEVKDDSDKCLTQSAKLIYEMQNSIFNHWADLSKEIKTLIDEELKQLNKLKLESPKHAIDTTAKDEDAKDED